MGTTLLYIYSQEMKIGNEISIIFLHWYLFDAHFKDKGCDCPQFPPVSLWNVIKWQSPGELNDPCRCHSFIAEAKSFWISF